MVNFMKKRIIAVLAAVMLVAALLVPTVVVNAAAPTVDVSFNTPSTNPGGTAKLVVKLANNGGFNALQANFAYNGDVLTCDLEDAIPTATEDFDVAEGLEISEFGPLTKGYQQFLVEAQKNKKKQNVDCVMNGDALEFTFLVNSAATPGTYDVTLTIMSAANLAEEKVTFNIPVQAKIVVACASHTAGDWEVKTPATCTATGVDVKKCTNCGAELETRTSSKISHSYTVFVETVPNTCTADGYDVYKCATCTATEHKNPTTKKGHDKYEAEHVDADCTNAGYTITKCHRCDLEERQDFEALGHDLLEPEVVNPTLEKEGSYKVKCDRCKEYVIDEVLDKLTKEPVETEDASFKSDAGLPTDLEVIVPTGEEADEVLDPENYQGETKELIKTVNANINKVSEGRSVAGLILPTTEVTEIPEGKTEITYNAFEIFAKYTDAKLLLVDDEGNVTEVPFEASEDGKIKFTTDNQNLLDGMFVIVGNPITKPEGDGFNALVFALIALVAAAGITVIGVKKYSAQK